MDLSSVYRVVALVTIDILTSTRVSFSGEPLGFLITAG